MAGDLVLITGATGHLGFRVLLTALEHGYQVRAAVRSEDKAKTITSNEAFKALNKEISFVTVPDFLAPNAFDEAVKGVKYIIHVASPLGSQDPPEGVDYGEWFVQPAVRGTVSVLEAAKKAGTVKRVVITSSVLGVLGADFGGGQDRIWTSEDRHADPGKYVGTMHAYAASKVAALNATEDFVRAEKPSFDIINIQPGFIFGRDSLALETGKFQTGTNRIPLNVAIGNGTKAVALPITYGYVNQIALAHVLSLDPKIAGNQSFLLTNSGQDGEKWEDIFEIVEKNFPEHVKQGIFKDSTTGTAWTTNVIKFDVKKTEETFGFKIATLEEGVKSVLEHYLEVLKKEKA